MNFVDKTLKCRDCGNDFEFTAGEQEFYQQKGLIIQPGTVLPVVRHAAIHPTVWADVLANAHPARCTQSSVPSAVPKHRCHSCPRMIAPCIAAPATDRGTSRPRLTLVSLADAFRIRHLTPENKKPGSRAAS